VTSEPVVHDQPLDELAPGVLYAILRLRSEVFVVEQDCVYLDPDGRDAEPGARQLWIADEATGAVLATARVLDDGDARRIGRIATVPARRGEGLAARLVDHFLATSAGPWRLDAQTQLSGWYERFGFAVDGPEYDDDGILHVPMARPVPA
jgi:ElaA protein